MMQQLREWWARLLAWLGMAEDTTVQSPDNEYHTLNGSGPDSPA